MRVAIIATKQYIHVCYQISNIPGESLCSVLVGGSVVRPFSLLLGSLKQGCYQFRGLMLVQYVSSCQKPATVRHCSLKHNTYNICIGVFMNQWAHLHLKGLFYVYQLMWQHLHGLAFNEGLDVNKFNNLSMCCRCD